jgi:hypothetical protein
MKKALLAVAMALFCISLAHAQTDVLIEIDRGRTEGLFRKSPVFQRAILAKPAKPTDTALLYFRGYPGVARIQSVADKQKRHRQAQGGARFFKDLRDGTQHGNGQLEVAGEESRQRDQRQYSFRVDERASPRWVLRIRFPAFPTTPSPLRFCMFTMRTMLVRIPLIGS